MRSVYPGRSRRQLTTERKLMQKLTFIFDDQKFEMEDTLNEYGVPDNAMGAANKHFNLPEGAWFGPRDGSQLTLGSGTEETSSINITAPVQLGPSSHPIPKPQATSYKHQAPSFSRCKRQASSVEQQASSFKPQAASSRTLCPS